MHSFGGAPNINASPRMLTPKPAKKTAASPAQGRILPAPLPKTVTANQTGSKPQPSGLMAAAAGSLKNKTGVYTSLQDAGFISNGSEFLQEVNL